MLFIRNLSKNAASPRQHWPRPASCLRSPDRAPSRTVPAHRPSRQVSRIWTRWLAFTRRVVRKSESTKRWKPSPARKTKRTCWTSAANCLRSSPAAGRNGVRVICGWTITRTGRRALALCFARWAICGCWSTRRWVRTEWRILVCKVFFLMMFPLLILYCVIVFDF